MRGLCLVLLLGATPAAFAQANADAPPPAQPPGPPPTEAPPLPAEGTSAEGLPQPPPPDSTPPPSAQAAPQPAPPAAAPPGQWVYTAQYGWLWIPYSRAYTYVPPDPQVYPDQFVYYPAYGWRWVVAPWVYGYGPSPFWGPLGPRYFVWYSRPWFRVGGFWGWGGYRGWGNYRGWLGPRVWGARGWPAAPAYYRSGVGAPHAHPVVRAPARAAPGRRRAEREERGGREHHR
jgi:hypothetical protein